MPDHSLHGDSSDYDTEGDEDMQKVLAIMPSLITLPLAPSISRPPATGSRSGLQETPPPSLPPSSPSKIEQVSLSRNTIHSTPPAPKAGQAEKASWSLRAVTFFDEAETAPPGLVPTKSGAGVPMLNMEQLQAALDSCPQTFTATKESKKREDKKKEGKDDEYMDQDVMLEDGQDKDTAGGEDKDGGSGTMA